ncbi:MAG: UDP-N-acetylmuramoyl-tripeptide--D-alanyl-D-alanine ligase [Rhodospirillales bacterium]|nr:UDP-N-acetylmuramoyl-tripeptide--D-alanyl-D-alanine ligase [Rhodospirillales bacterium]
MTRNTLWTDKSAADATSGEATEAFEADGVAFDSRQVADRDLFVALKGEQSDGHNYVTRAFEKGAAAAMVERQPDEPTGPLLLVVDTARGLGDLARAARRRTRARIAAVTGSVGKTGTKDALHHVLAAQGATHVSEKSFNNHVGTPLSLARMPIETSFGIFEVGTNAPGEIAPLSGLVSPHVALVTTVEAVHLGNFADETAVAEEKAAIFDALEEGGTALINADNRHADRLTARAMASSAGRIATFGSGEDCDHRLIDWAPDVEGGTVTAAIDGVLHTYRLVLSGHHHALNSVAILAVVHHLGADVAEASRSLAAIEPSPGRGRRYRVALPAGAAIVIDESYNASPVAVRAALKVLADMPLGSEGRRLAVLGDMLELGPTEGDAHAGLASDVISAQVDLLFAVGPLMNRLYGEMSPSRRGGAAGDARTMAILLKQVIRPGDVILVKGSRRIGLEAVVESLLANDGPAKAAEGR